MDFCQHCDFQQLIFKGLVTRKGRLYYFYILKSTEKNHECPFVPKKNKEVFHSCLHDLPSVKFTKLDFDLKRRLYSISYPVQRKKFWNCSTSCTNFGKKPTTFIVGLITWLDREIKPMYSSKNIGSFSLNQTTNAIVFPKTRKILVNNFVFNVSGMININFNAKKMADLTKFVEFNHCNVIFYDHPKSSPYFPSLFTSKVKILPFFGSDWHFVKIMSSVFNCLPNLERLEIEDSKLFKFLTKFNHNFGPKLSIIYVHGFQYRYYSLIAEFLKKQTSNIWFVFNFETLKKIEINKDELYEHFIPLILFLPVFQKRSPNRAGLKFISRSTCREIHCPLRDSGNLTDDEWTVSINGGRFELLNVYKQNIKNRKAADNQNSKKRKL